MGIMKLLGTSFSTILNGGNPTADRTVTFPDASGEALLQGRALTIMTAQNSTSGTSIDFTGIPSWAKRITVMFNGVSINSTNPVNIQLGTLAGVETTGYETIGGLGITSAVAAGAVLITSAIATMSSGNAASAFNGKLEIVNISGNTWVGNFIFGDKTATVRLCPGSSSKTLAGTLDRVRITGNGTDTFDAGSINVMYEG